MKDETIRFLGGLPVPVFFIALWCLLGKDQAAWFLVGIVTIMWMERIGRSDP
jgi:hypothetical protein